MIELDVIIIHTWIHDWHMIFETCDIHVFYIWYYTIFDFGIGCYLDLSTWKNVIFTEPQARWIYMYVFKGLINQLATYSKVNNCFISWTCFIVIYLLIHRHTNKISQLWSVCLWFSRKTNVKRNFVGYWRTNLIR